MDNVFATVPQEINIEDFLRDLHNMHPSILFRYEIENENYIPFLDTMVI